MIKVRSNFLFVLWIVFLINACNGDVLFRTQPCEDGMVRQGSGCVLATKSIFGECIDPDLSDLRKGIKVTMCDGSIGEGKLVDCTMDGEMDCVNQRNFKAVNVENLSSADVKIGKTVAGVVGSLRAHKQCRNYSSLTTFDSSYPPSNLGWIVSFLPAAVNTASDQITFTNAHGLITNSPLRFATTTTLPAPLVPGTTYYAIYVSDTIIQLSNTKNGVQIDLTTQGVGTHTAQDVPDNVAQYFDTIDDYNNNQASSPSNNPWDTDDYLCDATNFVNVTSTSAPLLPNGLTPSTGTQPFTQIWQDKISGMYISNILSVSGARTWSDAIRTCESLNGSTAGEGWRLPTQKELMRLYVHGIAKVPLAGGGTNISFWSSSGSSSTNRFAWVAVPSSGNGSSFFRYTSVYSVLCIR